MNPTIPRRASPPTTPPAMAPADGLDFSDWEPDEGTDVEEGTEEAVVEFRPVFLVRNGHIIRVISSGVIIKGICEKLTGEKLFNIRVRPSNRTR